MRAPDWSGDIKPVAETKACKEVAHSVPERSAGPRVIFDRPWRSQKGFLAAGTQASDFPRVTPYINKEAQVVIFWPAQHV